MEEEHQHKSSASRPASKTSPRSLRQKPVTSRRSPRMLNRSLGYQPEDDDEIEVLDDPDCSFNSQHSGSPASSRSRRSSIEVVDLEDSDDDDDIQEISQAGDVLLMEPREGALTGKVSLIQKKDEEILLVEDDDNIGDVSKFKRKSESFQQSDDNLKKSKVSGQTEVTVGEEIIEVKNKSGKSLFVKKSTLSKVMSETRLKTGAVSPVASLLATS